MPATSKNAWIYIVASQSGTLYTGVTTDLQKRIFEHKLRTRPGFVTTYGCTRLVYFEESNSISLAIQREKQIKGWTRARKQELIRTVNPQWQDLAEGWF